MMSRWCDQSIPDERHSAFSSGPLEVAVLFGTLVAETILAGVHVRAHKQAGHMDASDLIKHCKTPCKEGVVHIWKISHVLALYTWHSADMARLKISIVFESGARIGPGKAALLESIRNTGSISAAARAMGMSYKRAWLLLDSMNQAFTEAVVRAAPGGAGGGRRLLTPFVAEGLERYRRIYDRAATIAADDMAALGRRARPEAGPKI